MAVVGIAATFVFLAVVVLMLVWNGGVSNVLAEYTGKDVNIDLWTAFLLAVFLTFIGGGGAAGRGRG